MRGISPTAQDKWVKSKPKLQQPNLARIIAEVKADKITRLEQKIASIKAENDLLRELTTNTQPEAFQTQKLAQEIAILYGFRLSDLRGVDRSKRLVIARHHAMWLVRHRFPYMSLPAIGRMFGGRDHSTVHHALRAHPIRVAEGITMPDPEAA
jgi:chromosomal replication initiation ATPase DnaA